MLHTHIHSSTCDFMVLGHASLANLLQTLSVYSVASHIFYFALFSVPFLSLLFLPLLNVKVIFFVALARTIVVYMKLVVFLLCVLSCAFLHLFLERSLCSEVSPQFFKTRPCFHTAKWLSFSKFHFLAIQFAVTDCFEYVEQYRFQYRFRWDLCVLSISFFSYLFFFNACKDFLSYFNQRLFVP